MKPKLNREEYESLKNKGVKALIVPWENGNAKYDIDECYEYSLEEKIFRNFESNSTLTVSKENWSEEMTKFIAPKDVFIRAIKQALEKEGLL